MSGRNLNNCSDLPEENDLSRLSDEKPDERSESRMAVDLDPTKNSLLKTNLWKRLLRRIETDNTQ
jgi:hypothetical protein